MINVHASILIESNGNFLMAYHQNKKMQNWRFPGGKIEQGEMPIAAAARELFEELGIQANSLRLLDVHTHEADEGLWTGFYFLCEEFTGAPTIKEPEKFDKLAYIHPTEMQAYNLHPAYEMAMKVINKDGLSR